LDTPQLPRRDLKKAGISEGVDEGVSLLAAPKDVASLVELRIWSQPNVKMQ
jgi:catalase